jgi:hypothetical protein
MSPTAPTLVFLFGPNVTYLLQEVQTVWHDTNDPDILRQFIGNPQMGWKGAWSDRMVAIYTSMLLTGLVYWPFRRCLQPASLWLFSLLTLPLLIDGTSICSLTSLASVGDSVTAIFGSCGLPIAPCHRRFTLATRLAVSIRGCDC